MPGSTDSTDSGTTISPVVVASYGAGKATISAGDGIGFWGGNVAGVRIRCPDGDEYPLLLKNIHDPPNLLYVKGAFEPRDLNGIAIWLRNKFEKRW